MPLSAVGILTYVAGLLLGFGGYAAVPILAAAVGVVWSVQTQRAEPAALGLLLCGGALVARATAQSDAACRRALAAQRRVAVVLQTSAGPGAFARARAVACPVAVSLAVAQGSAGAGSVADASGTLVSSPRGLLIQHAVLRSVRPGPALGRWREAAGRRVDSLFGTDAPLARALLVADRRGLPPELRDRYAAAGLSHMLSISGLHVALIAVAVDLVFQLLRVSRRRANAATLVVIGAYVAMLGAPPPALRAAVMLGVWMLSRWWQRPTSPWAVLAIGAAIPLVDPRAVTAVGYQLSIAGVAALIAAARLAGRWPRMARLRGVARAAAGTALASTMAATVTAPLVAWNFGRLSLIGPITNVFAAPIMALAQPIMFLALALSPVGPVAHWFADAAHPLLRAFSFVAATAASVPGASVTVIPSAGAVALGGVFAVALVAACVSRFPGRALVVAAAALTLLAWEPVAPVAGGRTELHMIDVEQGDAIALRTARGHWVLVNAGSRWRSGDAGRSTVMPYLARRGGRLTAFVLTSTATDHAGGAESVIRGLRPRYFYDATSVHGGDAYRASLTAARAEGVIWRRAPPGDSLVVDEATLTFLGPGAARGGSQRRGSGGGLVIRVRVGRVRMLLVGDADPAVVRWLVAHDPDALAADVLEVGPRGAAADMPPALLAAVAPRVALLAVGVGGRSAPPGAAVMRQLTEAGVQLLRTDLQSHVVISTDGRSLRVDVDGDAWNVPARPSPSPRVPVPGSSPR